MLGPVQVDMARKSPGVTRMETRLWMAWAKEFGSLATGQLVFGYRTGVLRLAVLRKASAPEIGLICWSHWLALQEALANQEAFSSGKL
jgi:IS1 family transposase